MPARSLILIIRGLFVFCCVALGVSIALLSKGSLIYGAFVGLVFAGVVVGVDLLLKNATIKSFASGTFGLLVGVFCAWLLTRVPWISIVSGNEDHAEWQKMLDLCVYMALGYLGVVLALRSNRQEFSLIIPYVRFRNEGVIQQALLLDTNIIIDGRLPGICATGFVGGQLIVPRFVLDELHVLSDSPDPIKRERGRRGLECLEELRRAPGLQVTIHDDYLQQEKLVDTKLTQLARSLDARLLTNDANLGRVAQLQGVPVLNLIQLAQAMRPVVNIGDEIDLALVKEGRDEHQAVGYLADGTMIVVNHARERIGATVSIVVSSALQTTAGRLVFAELKGSPRLANLGTTQERKGAKG